MERNFVNFLQTIARYARKVYDNGVRGKCRVASAYYAQGESEMAKYKAIDIARWFLMRNKVAVDDAGGDQMSLLKLLKLLYYAEGCSLALERGSLFDDKLVAWEHGPVIESIYRRYKKNPYDIPFGSEEDYKSIDRISEQDKAFLENVFDVFGKYSAWGLRDMTHEETPWLKATKNGTQFNAPIDRKVMKAYFKNHYIAA